MSKAKLLWGIPAVFLLLAAQAMAQSTPDELAQKRAEQAQPRVAVAFDPPMFDKYVGYYQLGPKAIFTLSRDGNHFWHARRVSRQMKYSPRAPPSFSPKLFRRRSASPAMRKAR